MFFGTEDQCVKQNKPDKYHIFQSNIIIHNIYAKHKSREGKKKCKQDVYKV